MPLNIKPKAAATLLVPFLNLSYLADVRACSKNLAPEDKYSRPYRNSYLCIKSVKWYIAALSENIDYLARAAILLCARITHRIFSTTDVFINLLTKIIYLTQMAVLRKFRPIINNYCLFLLTAAVSMAFFVQNWRHNIRLWYAKAV